MTKDWKPYISSTAIFQGLDYAWRYNTIPASFRENTSTHLFWVTHYVTLLQLEIDPTDHESLSTAVFGASLHDLAEGFTGDIVRTFKYVTPELKQEIDRAEKIMINRLPKAAKLMFETFDSMIEKLGPGGKEYIETLIKVADFVAVYRFMTREYERGNREIMPFYSRMIGDLDMMVSSSQVVTSHKGAHFDPSEVYRCMHDTAVQKRDVSRIGI